MTETLNIPGEKTAEPTPSRLLLGRFAAQYADIKTPFDVIMPDGSTQHFGKGPGTFRVIVPSNKGLRALASLDEGRIAAAYLDGDIDLDGDMIKPFELRTSMKDFHLVTEAWRFIQPLLFGHVHTNKQAIASHYDIDSEFYLSYHEPVAPCYTQGVYESANKKQNNTTQHKNDNNNEKQKQKPNNHILE